MDRDAVIKEIKKLTNGAFTDDDLKGMEHATDEQLKFIVEGWTRIGRVKDKNTWDQILAVLRKAGDFGALIAKLVAAIAALA